MSFSFHVLQTADVEFYWELHDDDGDVLCTSGEAYHDFGDCLAGLYVFRGLGGEKTFEPGPKGHHPPRVILERDYLRVLRKRQSSL